MKKIKIDRIQIAKSMHIPYKINDSDDTMTSNQSWYTFVSLYGSDVNVI